MSTRGRYVQGGVQCKSKECLILPGEVRAKKPSLTQPEDQRFIGDFRTTTNDRAGGPLARTGTLSGHLSKQQPRSSLLDLDPSWCFQELRIFRMVGVKVVSQEVLLLDVFEKSVLVYDYSYNKYTDTSIGARNRTQ
ncbi:hypothetical protein J6590_034659 [Homalodisca vitripennis]|nr:hypothetical protein J6590_034659 [Homalodisca vitripennis]